MPSFSPSYHSRSTAGPANRLALAWFAALCVLVGLAGCEYFTSSRLEKLKSAPKPDADAAIDHGSTSLAPAPSPPTDDAAGAIQGKAPATGATLKLTTAEIVAMLERIIRGNRQELEDLAPKLDDQQEEQQARDVFQTLDDLVKSLEREKKKALSESQEKRVAEITQQLVVLNTPWILARERLNLDLRARMLTLERIGLLKSVIAHDQLRLNAILMSGDVSKILDDTKAAATAVAEPPAPAAAPPTQPAAEPTTAPPILPGIPLPAPTPAPTPPPAIPPAAAPPADAKAEAAKAEAPKAEVPKTEAAKEAPKEPAKQLPPSKELITAKRDLEAKSTAVQKLQERTMTLDARIQNIARSLELVQELAQVSRQSVENATQTKAFLVEEMQSDRPSVALQAWTKGGFDAIAAIDRRIQEEQQDSKNYRERYDQMVEERTMIADALSMTAQRAQTAQETLSKVKEEVEALESPLSSYHILGWLRINGPAILATLVAMALLYWVVSQYAHKIVQIFASRGLRGSKAERDNRMETLVSVLQNTGSFVILIGGSLTILSQAGIPVTPLLGGAAVAGVAVAFGAQNLIKDFFYGFMILLENQYKLKDVVTIGSHTGQVEQITLRMTALRDGDGGLHFLPNGATTSVINMTHGWSRAAFTIRIGLAEDADRVIGIIQDLGKEIRQDPALRVMIVDDLTMLGIDDMTDTAVILKFYIKTLPLQQWTVKREFLRRLKKKFDQMKVTLPPPPVVTPPPSN